MHAKSIGMEGDQYRGSLRGAQVTEGIDEGTVQMAVLKHQSTIESTQQQVQL
jgi:hypothetical protein